MQILALGKGGDKWVEIRPPPKSGEARYKIHRNIKPQRKLDQQVPENTSRAKDYLNPSR
jgi:hypothetical protein